MSYTIGEIANLLNLPTSTLRFYDKKGLLPFVERSKSGIRVFKNSDYEALKIIECLKKSSLSLGEIKDFMELTTKGDQTIDQRLQFFLNRKEEVEQKLLELQHTLDIVNYKCWYYTKAKEAGTESIHQELSNDDVPEELRNVRDELKLDNN